jgi:hypothetical protein
MWIATIVLMLAEAIEEMVGEPVSLVIWKREQAIKKTKERLDPNYLTREQFKESVFHRALHQWICNNQGKPLFHLDIHGRANYNTKSSADIGVAPVKEWFPKEKFV